MRSSCKILQTEFKAKLRKIINNFPSQSIRLSQFMELLTNSNIRMYSKAEVGKLSKIFDNPLKLCRIQVPLSHLMLDCVQENERCKYFIVRISPFPIHMGLYEVKNVGQGHNINKCLHVLVRMLRKMYGSQKNWFKVLGGFTIAITIDSQIFKKNIMKLLSNSAHAGCVDSIANTFLNECQGKSIEWKAFMKIISQVENQSKSDSLAKKQPNFSSHCKEKETAQSTDYRFSSLQRMNHRINRPISPIFSNRNKLKKSKTLKTEGSIDFEDNNPNAYQSLSLSSKSIDELTVECILYEKKSNEKQNMFFSTTKSSKYAKYSKFGNRKWNTTSHFYSITAKTELPQNNNRYKNSVKEQVKESQNPLRVSSKSKTEIDCVVLLQNESGVHIEI